MYNLWKRSMFAALLTIAFLSCKKEDVKKDQPILPSDIKASVAFDSNFENTIYPSLIISLNKFLNSQNVSFDFFTVNITNPKPNTVFKVVLEESKFNNESILTESLSEKGKIFSFSPSISWKFDELKNASQPGNISLNFKYFIDNQEVDRKILSLSYRSMNECVWAINDSEGPKALPFMFAAYINEDHPLIDQFLGEVLERNTINGFMGYQGDETSVLLEMWSIWYHLQRKGVKYSSITNTSNTSTKIISQYVRFFSEVYNTNQANCVDGTVFLASILKKLGIDPILVLEPGHMYLGFYAQANKQSLWVLETTMIGLVNLNNYTSEYAKREASLNSFFNALDANSEKYNSNISKMNDQSNLFYWALDVNSLRTIVNPINKRKMQRIKASEILYK